MNKLAKKSRKFHVGTILFCCLMMFPAVSHIIIFWAGIQFSAIKMAFTDYYTGEFTLFGNFEQAINLLFSTKGADVSFAFANTCQFFLVGVLNTFLALFAAYMLFKKMACYRFTRIALYLPAAISGLMIARLFNQFCMADGPLGAIVEAFGGSMQGTSLMTNESTAKITIMLYDIWVGLGGSLIIWYAAMNRIPPHLLEYGQLEGIGVFREFFSVVMPLIGPTFVVMFTLQIVNFFGSSGSVLVFTRGKYGTTTIAFWLFNIALGETENLYNAANAAGLLFLVLTIPILIVGRKIMNKFGQEVQY